MNTTFVNNVTIIVADWLNDVNDVVYDVLGDGINAPTTAAEVKANLGITDIPTQAGESGKFLTTNGLATNWGYIDLISSVTGTLPLANGGTGGTDQTTAKTGIGIITSPTGSLVTPAGTTAERDVTPVFGYNRANSTLTRMEWWNGTSWAAMGGGATGGGTDEVFIENGQTVTTDYTLTTNKNAVSVGPITINTGITVTVPTGSTWVIL